MWGSKLTYRHTILRGVSTRTIPSDWLPIGRTVAMRPAGQWWDAIRVPRHLGEVILAALGDTAGAVIEDPNGALLYWLVPPGQTTGLEELQPTAGIQVRGATTHIAMPGPQCTAGPHWRVPPTRRRCLTDPAALREAVEAAVRATFGPCEAAS